MSIPDSSRRSPLRRLLAYARPHRSRIRAATACSILNKIFDLAPPVLIGAAVDIVVQRESSLLGRFGIEDLSLQLWVLGGVTLVIWALESIFEYAQAILWRNLAQTLEHDLRRDAYDHLQRLDMRFFEERPSGDLIAILSDDINQLERFLDQGANEILQVGTTVVVIGGLFFALAPEVAWLAFVPIPVVLWGSFSIQRRLVPRYAEVREQVGELNGLLVNNIGGMATIKSFTSEAYESGRVADQSERYRLVNGAAIRLSSAFSPLIRMAIVVGFGATLIWGGESVLAEDLAVGSYAVMVFMTQRLLWPLTRLGATVDLYERAMASTSRVLDLLDVEIRVRSGRRSLATEEVRGDVEYDGVSFAYRDGHPVLHDLDLSMPSGSTVALVGSTGAGKSTVVKLLLRFYEPTSGVVRLDGLDLRNIVLEDLRRAIGFVSQDVYLFHGTVLENIRYGSPAASESDIVEAARAAEAHDFIERLPEGYETVVGERGIRLSGGQRQRISLARAVLKDPPILVLDEATSAVDNETEAAIQRSLRRIAIGRTTIVIAHRLSTIRHADQIVVFDDGRVVERGTHDRLVELGGVYASLWTVQTGEAGSSDLPSHSGL